ncbi:SDR family oxidoreductase [Ferrovibrio sp. MS7]|uniref:SDR family oxidoreductase n=1 Tax=Ferrovibrio plantarum TaxID=3119164 RepID=UPI003135C719
MSEQKTVIITAASRGIGGACSRMLASKGWRVVLMSTSQDCETLAAELGGFARRGSVTDTADLAALVDLAMEKTGRIDAVVANTGHGPGLTDVKVGPSYGPDAPGHLLDIDDADWYAALDMYVMNVIRLARLVTPIMMRQGGGAIVAVSSKIAVEPKATYPTSVLRLGLHAFAKLYADRYGRAGIRMNCLLPGLVENWPVPEAALQALPLGRAVKLTEIAETVAFLISDAAGGVTGQSILVDGGSARGVR